MYDNQVIVNDHVSVILMLSMCVIGIVVTVFLFRLMSRNVARIQEVGLNEVVEESETDDIADDPRAVSLIEWVRLRNRWLYLIVKGVIGALFLASAYGLVSSALYIYNDGITTKRFDEEIAVSNIEEKYSLTAVEFVKDRKATNENRVRLSTNSPEFVGIYNGNTVIHFVVAFKENSGEPFIAVLPPSDGITATQMEKSTSRSAPPQDEEDDSEEETTLFALH